MRFSPSGLELHLTETTERDYRSSMELNVLPRQLKLQTNRKVLARSDKTQRLTACMGHMVVRMVLKHFIGKHYSMQ